MNPETMYELAKDRIDRYQTEAAEHRLATAHQTPPAVKRSPELGQPARVTLSVVRRLLRRPAGA